MKNILRITGFFVLTTIAFCLSSCNGDDNKENAKEVNSNEESILNEDSNENSDCPGKEYASWKVDGTAYTMNNAFTVGQTPPTMSMMLIACVNDGVDKTISLSFIPFPPAVGKYPVQYKSMHGTKWNNTASAVYSIEKGNNYFTDDASNTGSFVISSIDEGAKTFTGTFEFTAASDDGSSLVRITDGTYTAKYN